MTLITVGWYLDYETWETAVYNHAPIVMTFALSVSMENKRGLSTGDRQAGVGGETGRPDPTKLHPTKMKTITVQFQTV